MLCCSKYFLLYIIYNDYYYFVCFFKTFLSLNSEYIKKATNSFKYNKINTTNQGSSSEWTTEGGREKKGEKKNKF